MICHPHRLGEMLLFKWNSFGLTGVFGRAVNRGKMLLTYSFDSFNPKVDLMPVQVRLVFASSCVPNHASRCASGARAW